MLVEKPLDRSIHDSLPMQKKARKIALRSAYFQAFCPAFRCFETCSTAGGSGDIVPHAPSYFLLVHPAPTLQTMRVARARGRRSLSRMGTPIFDVLIGLVGLPARVSAMPATRSRELDVRTAREPSCGSLDSRAGPARSLWNSKTGCHASRSLERRLASSGCHTTREGACDVGRDNRTRSSRPRIVTVRWWMISAVPFGRSLSRCDIGRGCETNRPLDAV